MVIQVKIMDLNFCYRNERISDRLKFYDPWLLFLVRSVALNPPSKTLKMKDGTSSVRRSLR